MGRINKYTIMNIACTFFLFFTLGTFQVYFWNSIRWWIIMVFYIVGNITLMLEHDEHTSQKRRNVK